MLNIFKGKTTAQPPEPVDETSAPVPEEKPKTQSGVADHTAPVAEPAPAEVPQAVRETDSATEAEADSIPVTAAKSAAADVQVIGDRVAHHNSHAIHPDGDAPTVIDVRDITKDYNMGNIELKVLKGITLTVRKGEFISIMGPSGSGKSTLMNILGALDTPTSGEYYLDGEDVSKLSESKLAQIRNKKIGFVFQSFNLLKRTEAIRQVELPLIYGSAKDRRKRAAAALESVGLEQRLDHLPSELSGGQQQRVAIARALVSEPAVILADEPTGNLDSRSGTEVMQIFQRLNREQHITTVFVTHDVWIARHTNRVIMLRDGKIVADQYVARPLVAGEAERPSEAEELEGIFEETYYGGSEEEYT